MTKQIAIMVLLMGWFSAEAQVRMQKKEGGLLFTENGDKVLFYQMSAKSENGQFERNNYIHPLWAPDGTVLTEDFPADHLHHRGIFWAWHQVWISGQRIGDPWEIKDFEQVIADVEYMAKNKTAVLKTEVYWKSPRWKKNGEMVPYIKENTEITIHPKNGSYRRIDFQIALLALENQVAIGGSDDEKGYGGFSVRMVLPTDVLFSGKAGPVTPKNEAVESPGFIHVSGNLSENGNQGGIVILDNPENPGYPQSWILRSKNSMQNAVFPGREPFPLSTTEPLVLKYTLLIYSGKMNDKKIEKEISRFQ